MSSLDFLWVALLGGLVGTGELITRYRDAPTASLRSLAALFYIALNALAAILALAMVRAFGVDFGLAADTAVRSWVQVLAAGFSALAVLRMSFFTLRAGDQDIGIGPSSLLQILLGASDRAVDRMRASVRATEVARIMAGVVFAKAAEALPAYCLQLMQNLPADDQAALARQLVALRGSTMDDSIKVLNLGLVLMNAVGPGVLKAAVESLADKIKDVPAPRAEVSP